MDTVGVVYAFVGTGSDGLDYVGRFELQTSESDPMPVWLEGALLDGRRLQPAAFGRMVVEGSDLIIQPTRAAPCG